MTTARTLVLLLAGAVCAVACNPATEPDAASATGAVTGSAADGSDELEPGGADLYEVTGIVTGLAQDPKPLASVTFNGKERHLAMTNWEGQFLVKNVQEGRYTVVVSTETKTQGFLVDIDGARRLDLTVKW